MKKSLFLLAFAFTIVSPSAGAAERGNFGLGFVLGFPSSITGKLYLSSQTGALQFGIGYWLGSYFWGYADYLRHYPGTLKTREKEINRIVPYLGVGAVVGAGTSLGALGVRIPLGLEWMAPTLPLEIFAELVPGISVLPGVVPLVQGGIGTRYFF